PPHTTTPPPHTTTHLHTRSEEHTSELQSHLNLVCRLLLENRRPHDRRHTHYFASVSFFFNDTATTEIYTLSLHDALPISPPHTTTPPPHTTTLLRTPHTLHYTTSTPHYN